MTPPVPPLAGGHAQACTLLGWRPVHEASVFAPKRAIKRPAGVTVEVFRIIPIDHRANRYIHRG